MSLLLCLFNRDICHCSLRELKVVVHTLKDDFHSNKAWKSGGVQNLINFGISELYPEKNSFSFSCFFLSIPIELSVIVRWIFTPDVRIQLIYTLTSIGGDSRLSRLSAKFLRQSTGSFLTNVVGLSSDVEGDDGGLIILLVIWTMSSNSSLDTLSQESVEKSSSSCCFKKFASSIIIGSRNKNVLFSMIYKKWKHKISR